MFTTNDILIKYKDELKELKKIIDIAIDDLEKDEKAYYDLIKDYLYDTSFEEFQQSLSNIKWINKSIDQKYFRLSKRAQFPNKRVAMIFLNSKIYFIFYSFTFFTIFDNVFCYFKSQERANFKSNVSTLEH